MQNKYDEKPFLFAANKFSPLGWYMEHFYGYLVLSSSLDIVGVNSKSKFFLELFSRSNIWLVNTFIFKQKIINLKDYDE